MKFIRADAGKPALFRLAIAPMVDVVFLLLVFFLCAAQPRSLEGDFDTRLPTQMGRESQREETIERVTVSVRITDRTVPREQMTPTILVARQRVADFDALVEKFRRLGPDNLQVIVSAEADVPTRFVVLVLDACAAAGCNRIAFAG